MVGSILEQGLMSPTTMSMTMPTDPTEPASLDASFEREALVWLPQVARFAQTLARNAADADDLVQETFLRAYGAWSSYAPGTGCRSWLFTICRNIYLRDARRSERMVSSDDPEVDAMAAAGFYQQVVQRGVDTMFDDIDLGAALERAIASLPDEYRSAVVLIDVQDCSYVDAAAALEIPVGTVRSRLFRGRRMLRERLVLFGEDAGFGARAHHRQPKFGMATETTV
jgi:RNA polymerase sigma-70 factor (ECF subfamily)